MSEFKYIVKDLWQGKSVTRAYLNLHLRREKIVGKTIDVGGGKNADYIAFMERENVTFKTFDVKNGESINFETDNLPAPDNTYDTVIFLNVMEHIFNYQNIANEVVRIIKKDGRLIGFVPFLMWYHPDHKDFFRYTHESLEIIFDRTTATNISIKHVSVGPFVAASQMIILSLPKFFRIPTFSLFLALDLLLNAIKGKKCKRYQLGYFFVVTK